MKIQFHKYQGTGNDFILIDNREDLFNNDARQISGLCDRNFGIGADGLILLGRAREADFAMRYFNADGIEVDMCGNGGRCIVAFAHHLGIIEQHCTFQAADGLHHGEIIDISGDAIAVRISLRDVDQITVQNDDYLVNTGVPHFIRFVEDTRHVDVVGEGQKIRYSQQFNDQGINVDFCHVENARLVVRTYERGVEDETLSCGTGITAASVAAFHKGLVGSPVAVKTLGGELMVEFDPELDQFKNIKLSGPVSHVFRGETTLY